MNRIPSAGHAAQVFKVKLIALALATLPLAAQAADELTGLGSLTGHTGSYANGVSGDGLVVVGGSYDYYSTAFRWAQSGGMEGLGFLPGGSQSEATSVNSDGSVVVGSSSGDDGQRTAFIWTQVGGMVGLGHLGSDPYSFANDVNSDGSVVVGSSKGAVLGTAFRWTTADGMVGLGSLTGHTGSYAYGVNSDGSVVVGESYKPGSNGSGQNEFNEAFRWTQTGGMAGLSFLAGHTMSYAKDVNSDGSVVIGASYKPGSAPWERESEQAFRWTQAGGMLGLGFVGEYTQSYANGVSSDGSVVVGASHDTSNHSTAFRWTQASGMKSVAAWLSAAGVTVAPSFVLKEATSVSADGSVVVGTANVSNDHDEAFIARVSSSGSGATTLSDVQNSLGGAAVGGNMALRSAGTLINGAHTAPLARRVAEGQNNFWLAGDWGRDDHGARDGDLGLAEIGFGRNFGPLQVNVSAGQTWATQNLTLNGQVQTEGSYVLAEALIPLIANLWGTLGAYAQHGSADMRRGYLNAGAQDYSTASPSTDTQGLRVRLDWDKALHAAGADFSPYADITYTVSKLDAYTETGGGFPARFDSRKDKATELRLGMNASRPITDILNLVGTLEAAHRFDKSGDRTSGQLIGLFAFNLDGQKNKQDWLRARFGVEGKIASGTASLALNVATQGETPNAWLAASWQKSF